MRSDTVCVHLYSPYRSSVGIATGYGLDGRNIHVRYEGLWDITSSPAEISWHFWGSYRLHSQARRQSVFYWLFRPWKWRWYVVPKRRRLSPDHTALSAFSAVNMEMTCSETSEIFTGLHCLISKKTELSAATTVRTSDPTLRMCCPNDFWFNNVLVSW
jgi:hypothetical protein